MPLLLTRADVAVLLAVSPAAIGWLHRTGQLRALKVAGKLRWSHALVERYLTKLAAEANS